MLGACAMMAKGTAVAYAADAEQCVAAFDRGQRARREGELKTARDELLVCSRPDCHPAVRTDCMGVLRQVEDAQPTIVLKATDARGVDLPDVRVEIGGRTIATSLDGRAIAVDPGRVAVVFHREPSPPVTVEVVLAEGEKRRVVQATLVTGREEPPSSALRPAPPPRRSVAGWAVPASFAAIGAGALVFAGVSRISLVDEVDGLRVSCAPRCTPEERDRLSGELVTVNTAIGVGVAALAVAAITWFVLAPRVESGR